MQSAIQLTYFVGDIEFRALADELVHDLGPVPERRRVQQSVPSKVLDRRDGLALGLQVVQKLEHQVVRVVRIPERLVVEQLQRGVHCVKQAEWLKLATTGHGRGWNIYWNAL